MSLENHRYAGNAEEFFNLPYAHVMLGKLVVDVTRKIGWPGMNPMGSQRTLIIWSY